MTSTSAPDAPPLIGGRREGRRTAVVLQPSYLPWLGYFAQMWRADVFVFYDDAQYDKGSWRNRNRIKTANGVAWLTVPVLLGNQGPQLIRDVRIDDRGRWRKKHVESLRQAYARAPFHAAYGAAIADVIEAPCERLLDLDVALAHALLGCLGLEREIVMASDLRVEGRATSRLVSICRAVGADVFYEGASGRDYLDERQFADAGIALEYQDYRHPTYPQLHGPFVPYLSVVDLVFNCGPRSLEILAQ